MGFKLAIDGPAASGKSTISSLIAKKLNWEHIDTGAMYRAVTLVALEKGINLNDPKEYKFIKDLNLKIKDNKLYINKRDISIDIRKPIINQNVSLVSSFKNVRKDLVDLQRTLAAKTENVVMDGRDIGTVVLPNANLKIFLTATVECRAKRRKGDYLALGQVFSDEEVKHDIELRDYKDSTRKESPLKKADDAIELDTTNLTITQVVEKIINLIKLKNKENI